MPRETVATAAKRLLLQASRSLGTADPLADVSGFVDETLAVPLDDPSASQAKMEPSFSETTPENLAFMVSPGSRLSPADRIETATHALTTVVGNRFGRDAARWVSSRVEAPTAQANTRSASWGASFASGFDRNGVSEAAVHYEWGPLLMDSLPAPLYRIARVALETLPGLRPAVSSVRCGRSAGSQQITFDIETALPLAALQPLMDRLGLGHRHPGLMSALAFPLGARFVLPPDTATLTLRPTRAGVELRIDVDLDALPDPPAQLLGLIRVQTMERPTTERALNRWLMAFTPDGYPGPGSISVLSVWVRPDLPARLALYLHPAALDATMRQRGAGAPNRPGTPTQNVSGSVASQALWSSSAWA